MKKIMFVSLSFLVFCVFQASTLRAQDPASKTAPAPGQNDGQFLNQQLTLLRKDIRSIKKQLIAANLTLTDSEATKFWPLYEQYSGETGKINETRAALIKEYADGYGSLTDDQADSLIRRWLDTDLAAAQLRQKYVAILHNVLPGTKVATFIQLDRRISMMIDLQLTSQLPLVQSQN